MNTNHAVGYFGDIDRETVPNTLGAMVYVDLKEAVKWVGGHKIAQSLHIVFKSNVWWTVKRELFPFAMALFVYILLLIGFPICL